MPQFILDTGTAEAAREFQSLDAFTQGYIEAAFFTSTGSADDAENGLEHATVAELAPETLRDVVADCQSWQATNADLLAQAYDFCIKNGYNDERAGNDYWYTRNGHGTGFWARGLGEVGDKLAAACRYHEVNMIRGDDGLIYLE